MRWEIRLQIGSLTHTHGQNEDSCNPVVLQFDPAQLTDSHVQLQHMVLAWSNQHGRQTALLESSPLICLHVDRCVAAGDGAIGKTDVSINVHGGCELPFFVDSDLRVVWKEYHVIAQIAHLGQDNAGHCRSLLHTAPAQLDQGCVQALLMEDWTRAVRICKTPYWSSSNITCLWLCRADQLDPYQVPAVAPGSVPDLDDAVLHPMDAMLSMFAPAAI